MSKEFALKRKDDPTLEEQISLLRSVFDVDFYEKQLEVLQITAAEPISHYLNEGWKLGLDPSPTFSSEEYISRNKDIKKAKMNPLLHYILQGKSEKRKILISKKLLSPRKNIALLYLLTKKEFDSAWYLSKYVDVKKSNMHPVEHFLLTGWKEGRDPSPDFSVREYMKQYPEVLDSGINPLVHYVAFTKKNEKIKANSLFSKTNSQMALKEYFDSEFYYDNNPDVKEANFDAYQHYMNTGWKEGRDPSPFFSTSRYLSLNKDVDDCGANPLVHYVEAGRHENRVKSKGLFDKKSFMFDFENKVPHIFVPTNEDVELVLKSKIAIHVHCYYMDVMTEFVEIFRDLDFEIKLYITISTDDRKRHLEKAFSGESFEFEIIVVPNRGRDVAPMLFDFIKHVDKNDICLHLHTKKSVEKGKAGKQWLKDLKDNTIFNNAYMKNIIRLMQSDEKLGLVYPRPMQGIKEQMHWGANRLIADHLVESIDIPTSIFDSRYIEFPAGNFFWFRPAIFDWIQEISLDYCDFPGEPISDDGTLAHTIERLTSIMAEREGYSSIKVERMPYHLNPPKLSSPKVSIVIPVYNAERWLVQSVMSCLMQENASVTTEVVIVDNGSSDRSVILSKMLSSVFGNVSFYQQPMKGAGAARNMGIKNSSGRYIMFLDADDVITPSAISDLYSGALLAQEPPDLVVSSLQMFSEDTIGAAIPHGDLNTYEDISSLFSENSLPAWNTLASDLGPCAKLYKKDFLLKHGIMFPEGTNFEDNYFVAKSYCVAENICLVRAVTYLYRKYMSESGSTQSTTLNVKAFNDQISIFDKIVNELNLISNHPRKTIVLKSMVNKLEVEATRFGNTKFTKSSLQSSIYLRDSLRKLKYSGVLNSFLIESQEKKVA